MGRTRNDGDRSGPVSDEEILRFEEAALAREMIAASGPLERLDVSRVEASLSKPYRRSKVPFKKSLLTSFRDDGPVRFVRSLLRTFHRACRRSRARQRATASATSSAPVAH